jgi:predicted choloylglycine hydrolase
MHHWKKKMSPENQTRRTVISQFSSLKGNSYEIGKQIGQWVLQNPQAIHGMVLTDQEPVPSQIPPYQTYFPDMVEEMQGTADTLQIPINKLRYTAASYLKSGYCSQFAIPAQKTQSGGPLIARNYEFADHMDDMNICHHQGTNSYAHIGSIMLWFGRYDGINDQGLAMSMSAGGIPVGEGMLPPFNDGFQFWTVMRAVLDSCKNVEEAIDLVKNIPHCGNPVYMLADASGTLARVEVAGKKVAVKQVEPQNENDWLIATNHMQNFAGGEVNIPAFKNSFTRFEWIENFLMTHSPVNEVDLEQFLDQTYPNGLCCNHYSEGFGTLRSMIFNPAEKSIRVRFGTPGLNEWKTIRVGEPTDQIIETKVIDEKAPINFWDKI